MSVLGTLGPFVQGSSHSRVVRLRTSLALAAAFLVAACATFAVTSLIGSAAGVADLSREWRIVAAALGLVTLASIDVYAATKATYCPVGLRRQTPKALVRRRSPTVVAAVWGFDTGLAVTTIRVAALTWGALLLVGLGLSMWFAGIGYGLGFALPFIVLLWTHRVGRASRSASPVDPGLGAMLAERRPMQFVSAALLFSAAALMVGALAVS